MNPTAYGTRRYFVMAVARLARSVRLMLVHWPQTMRKSRGKTVIRKRNQKVCEMAKVNRKSLNIRMPDHSLWQTNPADFRDWVEMTLKVNGRHRNVAEDSEEHTSEEFDSEYIKKLQQQLQSAQVNVQPRAHGFGATVVPDMRLITAQCKAVQQKSAPASPNNSAAKPNTHWLARHIATHFSE